MLNLLDVKAHRSSDCKDFVKVSFHYSNGQVEPKTIKGCESEIGEASALQEGHGKSDRPAFYRLSDRISLSPGHRPYFSRQPHAAKSLTLVADCPQTAE